MENINVPTENYLGFNHAQLDLWFNGIPCSVDVAETEDWFKAGDKRYQLWGKSVMITADGQGEANFPKYTNCEGLQINTEFGNFILRPIKDDDVKVYGVNNYRGLFLEKL